MFEQLAFTLPNDICDAFRNALKLGYWKNGMKLTDKQRLTCERALFIKEDKTPDVIR